jgi:tRNA uridine 5-carboxymethylaminomethyl modification enzyme
VEQLLKRPGVSYRELKSQGTELPAYDNAVIEQIEIEIKYAGYLKRQLEEINKFKKMESRRIPEWVDLSSMNGLKKEAKEKLQKIRPLSIGQAARISGITPADISILMVLLEKQSRARNDQ